jgi:hypothetical protein
MTPIVEISNELTKNLLYKRASSFQVSIHLYACLDMSDESGSRGEKRNKFCLLVINAVFVIDKRILQIICVSFGNATSCLSVLA